MEDRARISLRPSLPGRLAICLVVVVSVAFLAYDRRWDLYMLPVPDMHHLSIDTSGYSIESLPFQFDVSFVRGHDLFYADSDGRVFKADARNPVGTRTEAGHSHTHPRMLFVSSHGTLFISGEDRRTKRSTDNGKTWKDVLHFLVWRMDEDEAGSTLFAANYSPRDHPLDMAKLWKSSDDGSTWQVVFADEMLDHIHSVRYDSLYRRIYMTTGDSPSRGEVWSDGQGETWMRIASGRGHGHTDLAISSHYVFWGTDDSYGRIIRAPRNPVTVGDTILFAKRHQVWWIVARNTQIYAGTYVENPKSLSGAFLIASSDEGLTWHKLLEVGKAGSTRKALIGESRNLSSDGWVYFTTSEGQSYRARKT